MWLQLAFERVLMAIAYSVFQIRNEVKGVERQFIVISWMPCVDRQRILVNANPIGVYKHSSRIYRTLRRNDLREKSVSTSLQNGARYRYFARSRALDVAKRSCCNEKA